MKAARYAETSVPTKLHGSRSHKTSIFITNYAKTSNLRRAQQYEKSIHFYVGLNIIVSQDSVVSIVTRLWAEIPRDRASIRGQGQDIHFLRTLIPNPLFPFPLSLP